jgi:ribonuclease HII
VTDSKKLTERKRKNILAHLGIDFLNLELNQIYSKDIVGYCFQFCLFEHTPQQIDQMNILQASLSAMKILRMKLLFEKCFDRFIL